MKISAQIFDNFNMETFWKIVVASPDEQQFSVKLQYAFLDSVVSQNFFIGKEKVAFYALRF